MSDISVSLPGVRSPGVGFEQPFAMLQACHERVARSLDLLQRLLEHLERVGHDDQARAAAHDVWRYFEFAAPAHHIDEERHVLPLLLRSGDQGLIGVARRLQADHDALDAVWRQLGPLLRQVHESPVALDAATVELLHAEAAAFVAIHERHLPLEDDVAFPAAQSRLQPPQLQAMGDEMQRRRASAS
ncbi:MAG TPA: hemerythrin domain-containing protein [Burkholderiaceae bacterium]|nr:hemerythrin domain-containing protein [Burkholderiaceae bacterium]